MDVKAVVMMITLALADYKKGHMKETQVVVSVVLSTDTFIEALVDDEDARNEALARGNKS